MDLTVEYLQRPGPAFVFTNLVDFDSKYGHRNDPAGYAAAIEAFDRRLPELIEALDGGVLLITGDHGCDPDDTTDRPFAGTDATARGGSGRGTVRDRDRDGFGDLGVTVASLLGVEVEGLVGSSFIGSTWEFELTVGSDVKWRVSSQKATAGDGRDGTR